MTVGLDQLYDVIEATWPSAHKEREGPFTFRDGQCGGQRVSATTADGVVTAEQLRQAEVRMQEMQQPLLFMIRSGQNELDAFLANQGYTLHDPVNLYLSPVNQLATEHPPHVSMFTIWEPLQMQYDIWQAGGIGRSRRNVMQRVQGPKTSILSRWDDHPAATAFVALHNAIAMVHAVEVLPDQRRKGVARWLMRAAGFWAQDQGAAYICVLCTKANDAANALYTSLGMTLQGQYHYRLKKD